MFGLFGSKEKDRAKAESTIIAVHDYYDAARRRFPGEREILYLTLAWILYAKKHHTRQYVDDGICLLLVPAATDTLLFSLLDSPDSINALALFMVHKERLTVAKEYEPRFNAIMRNLKETGTQITVEQALANEVNYMSTLKCLDGISEEDF